MRRGLRKLLVICNSHRIGNASHTSLRRLRSACVVQVSISWRGVLTSTGWGTSTSTRPPSLWAWRLLNLLPSVQTDSQFTVGTVIQLASFGLAQITVGRFVSGLGVGALSAIVPLYIGEAAPKKIRGSLLVLYQVQIISGLFLAYIIDLATHKIPNSASWRIPIGLQIIWGVLLILGAWALPESPRLLLGKGKEEQALRSIAALNDCTIDDPKAQEMLVELEEAVAVENAEGKGSWLELFSCKGHMWKRTLNGMMIQFLQQLNGQNFYYVGLNERKALTFAVLRELKSRKCDFERSATKKSRNCRKLTIAGPRVLPSG